MGYLDAVAQRNVVGAGVGDAERWHAAKSRCRGKLDELRPCPRLPLLRGGDLSLAQANSASWRIWICDTPQPRDAKQAGANDDHEVRDVAHAFKRLNARR